MAGIDPNNIIPRWLRAVRSGTELESVLADARREHAGSMQHAIQDKIRAFEAQLPDEELAKDLKAIRDLAKRLGLTSST